MHYRSLINGVQAPLYWEVGDDDQSFRWNNYINRYHYRHLDLMDLLSAYQMRAVAPLDEIAVLLGCPGKMGMKGDQVWPKYQDGKLNEIRDYCETDVLNTYLVFLQFELMRGRINQSEHAESHEILRAHLKESDKSHFEQFLESWSQKQ